MAQTVFTNLYLHQIDKIEDNVIRNFSLATLKVVDIVKDFIAKGNVFEEEDFQPLTYGFKLGSEVRVSNMFSWEPTIETVKSQEEVVVQKNTLTFFI